MEDIIFELIKISNKYIMKKIKKLIETYLLMF